MGKEKGWAEVTEQACRCEMLFAPHIAGLVYDFMNAYRLS
jgi:hypothetical protein